MHIMNKMQNALSALSLIFRTIIHANLLFANTMLQKECSYLQKEFSHHNATLVTSLLWYYKDRYYQRTLLLPTFLSSVVRNNNILWSDGRERHFIGKQILIHFLLVEKMHPP